MKNFTIIIPFFNSSDVISRLFDSIPSRQDLEIIIVDDCSLDAESSKLKSIIDIYLDRFNICLLKTTKNSGAGAARNLGLRIATGKWMIFADADDYFMPSFRLLLDKYVDSDCDIVFFNATSIRLNDSSPCFRHIEIDKKIRENNETGLRYKFHGPVCKLVRSELVKQYDIHFFESFAFNDALFSAKIGYFAKKILIDHSVGYCITESSGSTTYTLNKRIIESRILATIEVNKFYRSVNLRKYEMPIFPQILYSRKLGLGTLIDTFKMVISRKENPFIGFKDILK